jgi:hypothetical protein
MIGLCLGLAGSIWAQLPVANFTLAWNHSIEKIRWEEDYRVTAQGLVLEQARVRGNGAGMEQLAFPTPLAAAATTAIGPNPAGRRLPVMHGWQVRIGQPMGWAG